MALMPTATDGTTSFVSTTARTSPSASASPSNPSYSGTYGEEALSTSKPVFLFPTDVPPHSSSTSAEIPPTDASIPLASDNGGPRPDVYYLVLLGILVVLVAFAILLTIRGHRMRRRYRTATQLAIARGEPVHWWRDDPDVLGIHDIIRNGPPPPGFPGNWANVGNKKRTRRWVRIPVLWDAEVKPTDEASLLVDSDMIDEKGHFGANEDIADWDQVQPLTVHSLLMEPVPTSGHSPGPATEPVMPPPPPNSVFGLLRYGFTSVPQYPAQPAQASTPRRDTELDRSNRLQDNEPLRVAFMIQMPVLPADAERERMARERERDEDEDEAGWRAGMEIAVWEGEVQGGRAYPPPESPSTSRTRDRESGMFRLD